MKNCPNCGAQNRDQARFCFGCGANLDGGAIAAAVTPDVIEAMSEPDNVPVEPGDEAQLINDAPADHSTPPEAISAGNSTSASALSQMRTIPSQQPPPYTPFDDSEEASWGAPEPTPPAGDAAEWFGIETEPLASSITEPGPLFSPAAAKETVDLWPQPGGQEDDDTPELYTLPDESPEPDTPTNAPPPSADPAAPGLAPGLILYNRFEIVSLLTQTETETCYLAWDRLQCRACDAANNFEDRFCVNCGLELTPASQACHIYELAAPPSDPPAAAIMQFTDNGRWYRVEAAVKPEPDLPANSPAPNYRLTTGQASHPGQVRAQDEDSLMALTVNAMFDGHFAPALGVFAVADGMGGHTAGNVASQIAIRVLTEWVLKYVIAPEIKGERCFEETARERLIEAVQKANGEIFLHRHQAGNEMGTTLTAALVIRDKAVIVNVGDSRTYLWQAGVLRQITTDHSAVARLIALGEVKPEDIYTHPQKTAIYRNLGDKATVEVDAFIETLSPGDRLVLCCDGIWESVRPDGLEEVLLAYPNPQQTADELIKRANLAGGEDNLSAIIISTDI